MSEARQAGQGGVRILVVEDESVIASDIRMRLRDMGYEVVAIASSGEEAVRRAIELRPDLVLMDILLQGRMDGIEAAGRIRLSADIPVIYLTAYANDDLLQRAKITEPFGYIIKPFEDTELRFSIEMALFKHGAEQELRSRNEFITNILNSLTHPFYVIDVSNYRIVLANPAANLGGASPEVPCYAVTHHRDTPCGGAEHPCTIEEVKRTGRAVTLEHTHFDKDNNRRDVEVHGYPIFDREGKIVQVIEYTIDITERKKLERQLFESQKLESVGRLAGGVAHDFSNIMSAVLGYSEMALMELPENHPVAEKLQIIRDAGEKAASLTRQLLAFSSRQVLEIKPMHLDETVAEMVRMLARVIGEDISLTVRADPVPRGIMADRGQVEQVIMNLAVNARDALPHGGSIEIAVEERFLSAEDLKAQAALRPGHYVVLSVSDNGQGMPREVQDRIFEPFYTTKGEGKGTGLGLSTVYGIVKQHQGFVTVTSYEGQGTTFEVFFPATSDTTASEEKVATPALPRGTESILVVDDEPAILTLLGQVLSSLGYTVHTAPNAEDAIAIFKREGPAIDLLVTDIVMPGMNGLALAGRLREERPGLRVLFVSGYSEAALADIGSVPARDVLQKPIRPSALAAHIRARLDAPPSTLPEGSCA
jgi:hypothetical protein